MSEHKYKFQWVAKGIGPKTAYFYAASMAEAKKQFMDLYKFEPTETLVSITRYRS